MKTRKKNKTLAMGSVSSMKEFRDQYLPVQSRKNSLTKMTPKQFGEQLADGSMKIVRKILSNKGTT